MIECMFFVSGLLTSILRMMLGVLLLIYFYKREPASNKKFLILGVAGGLNAICFCVCPLTQIQMIYLETLLLLVLAKLFLQIEMRQSLLVAMLYEITIWLSVFLVSVVCSLCSESEAFMNTEYLQGQISVWIVQILAIIVLLFVRKSSNMGAKEVFRIVFAIAIVEMFATIIISGMEILFISTDTVYMWLIFSLVLFTCVMYLYILYQRRIEQEVIELKQEQAKLLEKDYKTLNQAYEINAKLFHDFHNHIGALQQMLANKKYEEAVDYLDALQEPVKGMVNTVWTSDDTVDYLINSKMATAKECGITFHAEVEVPRNINISGVDFCAIIGNLIDNALDAAKQNERPEDRRISLTIRRIHQMLVIKVENPYTVSIEEENGEIKTTKKENGLHGWGLKSAKTAAEKYDGMVRTSYENQIFRAVATLSYEGISRK